MYIKCNTPEQLDEVKKYYNIREAYMSTINMFKSYNNEESICMDKYGNWLRYSFIKERNLDYITFSQWQLQTLRDLGFSTDLANDMLSRCDKFKRNDMNKKDQFIQLEGGKLNITKARELGLWVEDKPVFKWDKSYKEIQYKDYTICGTNEYIRIYKGCNKILVMVEPSIDKLRSEFAYYGIEVEVV